MSVIFSRRFCLRALECGRSISMPNSCSSRHRLRCLSSWSWLSAALVATPAGWSQSYKYIYICDIKPGMRRVGMPKSLILPSQVNGWSELCNHKHPGKSSLDRPLPRLWFWVKNNKHRQGARSIPLRYETSPLEQQVVKLSSNISDLKEIWCKKQTTSTSKHNDKASAHAWHLPSVIWAHMSHLSCGALTFVKCPGCQFFRLMDYLKLHHARF